MLKRLLYTLVGVVVLLLFMVTIFVSKVLYIHINNIGYTDIDSIYVYMYDRNSDDWVLTKADYIADVDLYGRVLKRLSIDYIDNSYTLLVNTYNGIYYDSTVLYTVGEGLKVSVNDLYYGNNVIRSKVLMIDSINNISMLTGSIYLYDGDNLINKVDSIYLNGNKYVRDIEYEYNNNHIISKVTAVDMIINGRNNNVYTLVDTYYYDGLLLSSKIEMNSKGHILDRVYYKYDNKDRLISVEEFNYLDKIQHFISTNSGYKYSRCEYVYDNDLLKYEYYYDVKDSYPYKNIEYVYNDGELILKLESYYTGVDYVAYRMVKYYR